MRLFLVQHGEARSEQEDPDRPLTDRGAADVRRVAAAAAASETVSAVSVIHSGKTRARQTAETWGEALGAPVEQSDGLAPKDDPSTWTERLDRETRDVMLVGHLPHLARLTGQLLAGDPDRVVIAFRPGGLVGLDRSESGWSASVVLPPDAVPTPE